MFLIEVQFVGQCGQRSCDFGKKMKTEQCGE